MLTSDEEQGSIQSHAGGVTAIKKIILENWDEIFVHRPLAIAMRLNPPSDDFLESIAKAVAEDILSDLNGHKAG